MKLTKAQAREYKKVQELGTVSVEFSDTRLMKIYKALEAKTLIRISYVLANVIIWKAW